MEKKYKRIPFDLELAKAITKGEKEGRVVTRDCYPIEYLDFEHEENEFPVIAIIRINGNTRCEVYAEYGFVISKESEQDCDLFLEVPDEQEFNEGDVVMYSRAQVAIYKGDMQKVFAWTTLKGEKPHYDDTFFTFPVRLATPEEKQTLIDSLKKDNSDKAREYLKRFFGIKVNQKFKPFDKVLVRDNDTAIWQTAIYSHYDKEWGHMANSKVWDFCIPYNEQTKHLLGTTDDWEG